MNLRRWQPTIGVIHPRISLGMPYSLNQVEQTSRKAARGAGLSWGLADEVGKALRWLHSYGLDGIPVLVEALCRHAQYEYSQLVPVSLCGRWHAKCGVLDPLAVGASLSDCLPLLHTTVIQTEMIAYPLLVAGFIGTAAEIEDLAFTLTWPQVRLQCRRGGMKITAEPRAVTTETASFIHCKLSDFAECAERETDLPAQWQAPHCGEIVIESAVWNRLEQYMHRTYVEASEASRMAGAGAGLHDND